MVRVPLIPEDDGEDDPHIMAEINVTPLTDVFLVLLIIFMVTTSAAVQQVQSQEKDGLGEESRRTAGGIQVDLPRAAMTAALTDKQDVEVWLGADGSLAVGQEPVDQARLLQILRAKAVEDPDTLVVLRADTSVPHGRVVSIMDLTRQTGLTRLAVATRPAATAPQPPAP